MGIELAANGQLIHYNVLVNNNLNVERPVNPRLEKVKLVVKVIFSVLLSLAFFSINPAMFFVSFVIGVAFNKAVQEAVEKIKMFVLNYKFAVAIGCVAMGVIVLPVFIAAVSVVWSAYVGSYLSARAQQAQQQNA